MFLERASSGGPLFSPREATELCEAVAQLQWVMAAVRPRENDGLPGRRSGATRRGRLRDSNIRANTGTRFRRVREHGTRSPPLLR